MSDNNKKRSYSAQVSTPVGTILFPHLVQKDTKFGANNAAYKATILIPSSADLAPLHKAIRDVAKQEWNTDDLESLGVIHPFQDGNLKAENFPSYADCIYFTAKSRQEGVKTVGTERDENGKLKPIDPADIYSGCKGRLSVVASASEIIQPDPRTKEKITLRYVTFFLNAVQKTGDGRSMGGDSTSVFGDDAGDVLE